MTCTGACCVAFPISMSWDRLYDRWPWIEDGDLILNMLLLIPAEEVAARRERLGAAPVPDGDHDRPHYACRHWDARSRKCTNYLERPIMCHSYPNHEPCEHCGAPAIGRDEIDLVAIAEARA